MELESKVGQLLFVGIEGTEESSDLREFLEEFKPGGIVLFARNIQSPDQVRRFCAFLSAAVDPAPFLSIDQEGGRVNRLSPLVGPLPPAAALARQTKKNVVREFGVQTGRALKALGFNMDFAPCVDLSTPEATNGIAERAFGNDARTVVRLAGAFLDGLQSEGVAGVLKHFRNDPRILMWDLMNEPDNDNPPYRGKELPNKAELATRLLKREWQWAREVKRSSAIILRRLQTLLGTDAVTSISVRSHERKDR